MKNLIYLTFLWLISITFVFGQTTAPPPPPPPLIFSAPAKDEIKTFVSGENNFSADFAGEVFSSENVSDKGLEKRFSSKFKGMNQEIEVFIPSGNTSSGEKDFLNGYFENLKNDFQKSGDYRLISENDLFFNGLKGKEIAFENSHILVKIRLIGVKNKIYKLSAKVVNVSLLKKYHSEKLTEFETESTRFFNSFQILPVEIGEKIEGNSLNSQTNISQPDRFNSKTGLFESSEGAFSVKFPARPKKEMGKITNSYGATNYIIYSVPTNSAFLAVTYFDTPVVITEENQRNLNYEDQKNAIIEKLKAKLISENDVMVGNFKGKEFVFAVKGNTSVMRVFFANQRLFRLLITTTGITGKLSRTRDGFNKRLADNFFNSFTIGKLPKPEFENFEKPKDYGIRFQEKRFFVDYFGVSLEIPENWQILGDFEKKFLKQATNQMLEEKKVKNLGVIQDSLKRSDILLVAINSENENFEDSSNIIISAEKTEFPVFNPKITLEFSSRVILDEDEIIVKPISEIKISGIEFAWYETFSEESKIRQRLYLANINKLAFQVLLSFKTDEELVELLQVLNSLEKFR